ncbi:MAG TPA: c-type cytochrome [Rudaea sp.]|jgi:cytochrome c5|nr:c-type cytochrome [Rudaea sp.]
MNPLSATDRQFLKQFAIVVAGLHVVALFLLGFAFWIYGHHPPPAAPDEKQSTLARIAPVGAVYAGETGRAAALAAQERARSAAAGAVAYGGTKDGKTIFDNLCHACHETGVLGAPKVGDASAWGPRVSQGLDVLFNHAINGFQGKTGTMPPRGGNPALSDDQVKAAVQWMVAQVKK